MRIAGRQIDLPSLLISGIPVGALLALAQGLPLPHAWAEFLLITLVAGAIAGVPAGVMLVRELSGSPSGTTLGGLLVAAFFAAIASTFVVPLIPMGTWEPLPQTPEPVSTLAGPRCYGFTSTVIYARTDAGKAYRMAIFQDPRKWAVVDSVPSQVDDLLGMLCPASDSAKAGRAPQRRMSITEEGADCGGTIKVRLRSDGLIYLGHRGMCALLIPGLLIVGIPLFAMVTFIAWAVARWRHLRATPRDPAAGDSSAVY